MVLFPVFSSIIYHNESINLQIQTSYANKGENGDHVEKSKA